MDSSTVRFGGRVTGADVQTRALELLRDGHEDVAAQLLSACRVQLDFTSTTKGSAPNSFATVEIELVCEPHVVGRLRDSRDAATHAVWRSLRAVLPAYLMIDGQIVSELPIAEPRRDYVQLLDDEEMTTDTGEHGSNQGLSQRPLLDWNGLRFRSQAEVCIAKALDRAGVLFFPNCKARLGAATARCNREPDFLVCHEGRWGMLEVDGEPFHPAERTVHEQERDRLFKDYGLIVIEHYDAARCMSEPDAVVAQFLRYLRQS